MDENNRNEYTGQPESPAGIPDHSPAEGGWTAEPGPVTEQLFPQHLISDGPYYTDAAPEFTSTELDDGRTLMVADHGCAYDLAVAYRHFPKLQERARQAAGTLSGGEQQMLAVARALIGMPRLLILDEPSLGLAPNIVDDILDVASSMARNNGIAVLLVEQDITKALACADRGYVIENGRIALQGAAGDLATNEHVKKAYLGI